MQVIKIRCSSQKFIEMYKVQNTYLNKPLGCVSVSHDSGAFSNDSLFQTSSLGHGLQKASVKARTIPSCCPSPLPCLHDCGEPVVSWDAGPYQQKLKPSSTPGFLFSSLSPQWKHSQTNANLKKGLCRPIFYCDIVSMSLLPGCKDFWLFGSLFAKYTVLYHIHISEDQNGKKKTHSTAGLRKLLLGKYCSIFKIGGQ